MCHIAYVYSVCNYAYCKDAMTNTTHAALLTNDNWANIKTELLETGDRLRFTITLIAIQGQVTKLHNQWRSEKRAVETSKTQCGIVRHRNIHHASSIAINTYLTITLQLAISSLDQSLMVRQAHQWLFTTVSLSLRLVSVALLRGSQGRTTSLAHNYAQSQHVYMNT